jgi:hypothetical protein
MLRKSTLLHVALVSLIGASSCKKTCIEQDDMTIQVGRTVTIKSCTDWPRIYDWQVNGTPVAPFADPLYDQFNFINADSAFFALGQIDFLIEDGGWFCDDFVVITFGKAGVYELTQGTARVIKSGSCESGNFETEGYHERSITITVVE